MEVTVPVVVQHGSPFRLGLAVHGHGRARVRDRADVRAQDVLPPPPPV
jgi:hypothetical protein